MLSGDIGSRVVPIEVPLNRTLARRTSDETAVAVEVAARATASVSSVGAKAIVTITSCGIIIHAIFITLIVYASIVTSNFYLTTAITTITTPTTNITSCCLWWENGLIELTW